MKNFLLILLVSLLSACSGSVVLSVDGGLADSAVFEDGSLDAAPSSDDAEVFDAALDAFADDAGDLPDSSELADAAPVDAPAPDVALADACARSAAAYEATTCDASFYTCRYTASTIPEARVVACEEAIAFGYSEGSGPPDRNSRCIRAIAAMNECRE